MLSLEGDHPLLVLRLFTLRADSIARARPKSIVLADKEDAIRILEEHAGHRECVDKRSRPRPRTLRQAPKEDFELDYYGRGEREVANYAETGSAQA